MENIEPNVEQNDVQAQEYPQQQYAQPQQQADWRAGLAPELQPAVSRFNDLSSLVKSYSEAQGLLGKKVESYAKDNWESYQSIMSPLTNIPTSPNEYKIDFFNENGESFVLEEDSKGIVEACHHLRLDNDQAQGLHDIINSYVSDALNHLDETQGQALESCVNTLEKEWGNASETKMKAIDSAIYNVLPNLAGISGDQIKEELMNAGIMYSPTFMKVLAGLGELCMDSSSRGTQNIAPMDARMRLDMLRSDPDFMAIRRNPLHPQHQQVKAEFSALCEAVNK